MHAAPCACMRCISVTALAGADQRQTSGRHGRIAFRFGRLFNGNVHRKKDPHRQNYFAEKGALLVEISYKRTTHATKTAVWNAFFFRMKFATVSRDDLGRLFRAIVIRHRVHLLAESCAAPRGCIDTAKRKHPQRAILARRSLAQERRRARATGDHRGGSTRGPGPRARRTRTELRRGRGSGAGRSLHRHGGVLVVRPRRVQVTGARPRRRCQGGASPRAVLTSTGGRTDEPGRRADGL